MPDTIDIAIGIDLADRMGLRARDQASTRPVLPYEGKAPLGTLSIRGNQVFWDGKILARQDVAAIAQACRDKL
ncbi:MAG: hypothetical protein KDE14_14005 [Rhodobacteraceae bacterium]|nr:hypothetical protein [Paracoccaceae bacterium]